MRWFPSTKAEDQNQFQHKSLLTEKTQTEQISGPSTETHLDRRETTSQQVSQLLAGGHPHTTEHAEENFLWKLSKNENKQINEQTQRAEQKTEMLEALPISLSQLK